MGRGARGKEGGRVGGLGGGGGGGGGGVGGGGGGGGCLFLNFGWTKATQMIAEGLRPYRGTTLCLSMDTASDN